LLTYSNISAYTDWSQFIVTKRSAASIRGLSLSSNPGGVLMSQWNDNSFYIQRVTSGGDLYCAAADVTADYVLISGFTISAGGMTAYKNATAYSLGAETGFATTASVFSQIGAYGTSSMSGSMSEVVLYASDKSSDRVGIQTNINTFFALW